MRNGIIYKSDGDKLDSVYDDYCYECRAYGYDYRVDENGNLVSNCADCPFNEDRSEDEVF